MTSDLVEAETLAADDGSPRLRFDNGVWKSAEINDRWQR